MPDKKPLSPLAVVVAALLGLGYALIRLPVVSGVQQLVNPALAIGLVVVLLALSGAWVFKEEREYDPDHSH